MLAITDEAIEAVADAMETASQTAFSGGVSDLRRQIFEAVIREAWFQAAERFLLLSRMYEQCEQPQRAEACRHAAEYLAGDRE